MIQQKRGEIEVMKSGSEYSNFKELIKVVPKNLPLILGFSGKGILNKKAKKSENYRTGLFMNANEDDFFFYETEKNSQIFISIIRNEVVDEELDLFRSQNLFVVDIYVGPFVFDSTEWLNQKNEQIIIEEIEYHFHDNDLISYAKTKEKGPSNFQLEKLQIEHSQILPLFGAYKYLTHRNADLTEKKYFRIEQEQKTAFNRLGAFTLIFFLFILSGNYVYLNSLNNEIGSKNQSLSEHEESLNRLNQLEEEKKRKLSLLNRSGILNQNFLSFYLDEIAYTLPETLSLEELNIYPIQESAKNGKQIEIEDQTIFIKGNAKSSRPLNLWVQSLKKEKWIQKIEITNYQKNRKKSYTFELLVQLK